ncbi:MAG: YicC/YloC family endoribonuclease [Christensenellales bacterium]
MTGFGRSFIERDGREILVEIKSVNHRFLDLSFRTGRNLAYLEEEFRKIIPEHVTRGHLDIWVTYNNNREDAREVKADYGLLGAYLKLFSEAGERTGLENDLQLSGAMRLPDVMTVQECQEDQDTVLSIAKDALKAALIQIVSMREAEGEKLSGDALERVSCIRACLDRIEVRTPLVTQGYREKLMARINEFLNGTESVIDESRLNMEIAVFADKSNITEEIVRLRSHFSQFCSALKEPGSGRKLDFIVQEMNREVNTIGSKASDLEITNQVLLCKCEIEKIREQIQNIE